MGRMNQYRAWDNVKDRMYYLGEEDDVVFHFESNGIVATDITEDEEEFRTLHHLKYMQYTSLKDHNGNEIYEGDILKCGGWSGVPYLKPYAMPEKHAKGENFIVVKMDCGFVLRHISGFGTTSNTFYHIPNGIIKGWPIVKNYDFWNLQRSFEVIGNIYENQELLKGSDGE